MFWYFFITALVGFISGMFFYNWHLTSYLSSQEKIYLKSFYKALKEGRYNEKSDNENE